MAVLSTCTRPSLPSAAAGLVVFGAAVAVAAVTGSLAAISAAQRYGVLVQPA